MARMHLQLCIGWLERREGLMLGLRELVQREILATWPDATVGYASYKDDVAAELGRRASEGARPMVLVGHSYGGAALVRAARLLPTVTVDHLILLDPVPRWAWGQVQWDAWWLTANVRAATCIYNPRCLPWSVPIVGGCERFDNVRVNAGHSKIPADPAVQAQIVELIRQSMAACQVNAAGRNG